MEGLSVKPEPKIIEMASGNLSLLISEDVSWEGFPEQAREFMEWSGGYVIKKIDTPVERMWVVLIKWRPFFLTFDDFPLGLSLDSMTSLCNPVVKELHHKMMSSTA
jgi:hypothetical protein